MVRSWTLLLVALAPLWGLASQPQAPLQSPAPEPTRFVKVELQILTAGEKRPVKEVGAFVASLPLGKPGTLERKLEISSASQGSKTEAILRLVLTPSLDESGLLHCLALSESTFVGKDPETRIKDLTFPHPGSQVMDLLSDPVTTTRVILSVSAQLVDMPAQPPQWPQIRFGVRVEHWLGNSREEVEALQLQSLEGQPVSHRYVKKIPRVIEGRQGGLVLEDLPIVEEGKEGTSLKAGESFVVKFAPDEKGDKKRKKKKLKSDRNPEPPPTHFLTEAPKDGAASESPGTPHSLIWEEEYYDITVTPLQISRGGMRIQVAMEGQLFDPGTGLLQEKLDLRQEKEVLPGQPVPFYLTRELPTGPQGFVAWVLPYWEALK